MEYQVAIQASSFASFPTVRVALGLLVLNPTVVSMTGNLEPSFTELRDGVVYELEMAFGMFVNIPEPKRADCHW